MADYYPPIAQAVNGLEMSTAETRLAIYDRARTAMVAQLRSLTPALSESAINRETSALEEAIRKAERESLQRSFTPPRPSFRQPDPLFRPIRENRDEPAEMSDAGGGSNSFSRLRSSTAGPQCTPRHTPVVARPSMNSEMAETPTRLPRRRPRAVALTIMGLLVLAFAASGILNGARIIAMFRVSSNSDGTGENDGPADRVIIPKMADRISVPPVASTGPLADALAAPSVVLYEQDEVDPAGKRFGGTAAWRAESISPGAGRLPKVALRADIEIPERRISLRWTLKSNDDASMAASHTMEIMFTMPPEFSRGGISRIPGVLMKQAENSPGVPLAGVGVKVAPNLFLISLSLAEADMQRNVQLLKERSWFDIPIVYEDGHRGIIAIEKGSSGDRAFSDAFASWEQ